MLNFGLSSSLLKKVLVAITDLVDQANLDCSATGISLQGKDSSDIASVILLLRSEGFNYYQCDPDRSLGMDLKALWMMVQYPDGDGIFTITNDDGSDYVRIMRETQGTIRHFWMNLISIDRVHLVIPEARYDAMVRMHSADFACFCKCLSTLGDTVQISVTQTEVKFSMPGDFGNFAIAQESNITEGEQPEEATVIRMIRPVSLTCSLRYLRSFAKATPLSNTVIIALSNDLPLAFEYKVAEMGYVRFYLAPLTRIVLG